MNRNILSNLLTVTAMVVLVAAAIMIQGMYQSVQAKDRASYITIKGSDTMVHLVSTWAEEFMKAHKGIDVSVTGGGSGTGIAALINGTTDVCAASRKMKGKEYKLAEKRNIKATEFVVARDGIAVVVNPANPVGELTLDQLMKIFTGAYTNWNQVGGPDQKIIVLSRESSSGTYVFFQEHVLQKNDYTERARLMPATSSIIQTIGEDKWSIGYVGLGYAAKAKNKIKMLAVKVDAKAEAVMPSEGSVKSGDYSIARPLHLYLVGEPTGNIKTFLDFCLSKQGQKIVKETGYVSL